ncbi:MAG: hypothetical protein ACOY3J_04755 [Bacillota bacterium]|uniref:Membrane protein YkvI n=1 Tax=Thermanaerosceptrum fracticalcis TaxID=1712410 RepID=A0A7G6E4Z7_THEFR|nr:membrane protein [Thermanaerosceptrum fracticalcis]QNB47151.1 hypothetical protein BR63_13060 [Thermanaerosceptrum fracticalcis]
MSTKISPFQVAATYIGTVVGAGFASGQEVLQFFGYFGPWGIAGLFLAGILFFYFGQIILRLGHELEADSHVPVIHYAGGKWLGTLIDYVITFFLFGALTAMVAGAGSIFFEQFRLSPLWGNALMVVATLVTVLAGISGVITAISFVVPLLLAAVLGISLYTLAVTGFDNITLTSAGTPAVPRWPLAAIVYVSYNLVMAVAILAPMGKAAEKRVLRQGALLGGLGLGVGALAILLAVLATLPGSAKFSIPMIYVAGQISPWVQTIYSIVLFAEVYTTAVGSLYGFVVRLAEPDSPRIPYIAVGASIGAFVASQFGFTNLVRVLYPAVGYAGLLMLAGLLYRTWGERLVPQPAFRKKPAQKEQPGKEEENK